MLSASDYIQALHHPHKALSSVCPGPLQISVKLARLLSLLTPSVPLRAHSQGGKPIRNQGAWCEGQGWGSPVED